MIATIEISMYPLREQYSRAIDGLIELLEERAGRDGFKLLVQPTCTLICGEYDVVLRALHESIPVAHEKFGQAVYLTKIIPDYHGL